MRIIAGKFKNKKIIKPLDKFTRPLKDITKESIFNILKHSNLIKTNIENSKVLDLFSGTGSFGLECISRGAEKVFFCENYDKAINILEKNIKHLGCSNNVSVIKENSENLFKKNVLNNSFNIIFLDPPFKSSDISNLLTNINKNKLLDENGIIILHRNKKSKDVLPINCQVLIEKIYGISKILFITF